MFNINSAFIYRDGRSSHDVLLDDLRRKRPEIDEAGDIECHSGHQNERCPTKDLPPGHRISEQDGVAHLLHSNQQNVIDQKGSHTPCKMA